VTPAERAVRAVSQARDLCLSLRRAFAGASALDRVRAGEVADVPDDELGLALGLAWAAEDFDLVRRTLASLPASRIAADPVLGALRDATR
jgi:hypothetical protein